MSRARRRLAAISIVAAALVSLGGCGMIGGVPTPEPSVEVTTAPSDVPASEAPTPTPAPTATPQPVPKGTKWAVRCGGVRLRSGTTTSSAQVAMLNQGDVVVASGSVAGGPWSFTDCGGSGSGSQWIKVVAVNGRTVQDLYGVKVLYAAQGLFTKTK
jgi:hypothetical protein